MRDAMARSVQLAVTLNKTASVGWRLLDADGAVVRTVRSDEQRAGGQADVRAGTAATDGGAWVPDGWYRSVVTATTALGSYAQERSVYVGAFRVTPSISSPARGARLTLTIISSEGLAGAPTVRFSQPGIEPWTATASRVSGKQYKLTVTLPSGGGAGTLALEITGTDKEGGLQRGDGQPATALSLARDARRQERQSRRVTKRATRSSASSSTGFRPWPTRG